MIIFTVGAVGNIIVIYGFKSNKKLRQERDFKQMLLNNLANREQEST